MNRVRAYCELVRLPNALTAFADVLAGFWFMSSQLVCSWRLAALLLTSACLYSAGIVINDRRDIEVDRRERPLRPLPSGRVSSKHATILAIGLSILGVAGAGVAGNPGESFTSIFTSSNRSGVIGLTLLGAILGYDLLFKSTIFAPLAMGSCRVLNLMLGFSLAAPPDQTNFRPGLLLLIAFFLYFASVTYFGRDEAGQIRRRRLITGCFGIVVALFILGSVTSVRCAYDYFTFVLWLALSIHLGRVAVRAIRVSSPPQVRYAMKTFILGIIALDATIASAAVGWQGGVCILLLLIPAAFLGRWVYST